MSNLVDALCLALAKQVSKALAARRERVEQAIKQRESIDAVADPKLRELGKEVHSCHTYR